MELSLAHFYTITRDYPRALAHGRRGRGLCVTVGWQRGEATALGNLCAALADAGDIGRAATHLREALAVHRRTGWRPGECTVLSNLGLTYQNLGRLDEAATTFAEALELARKDPPLLSSEAVALINIAEVHLLMDRRDEAGAALDEAERSGRAADRLDIEIYALVLRSELSRVGGDPDVALTRATAALRLAVGTDNRLVSLAHCAAGAAQSRLGEHGSAVAHLRRACRLARQTHSRYFEIETFVGLADALRSVDASSTVEAAAVAERAAADARGHGYGVLEGSALAALARIEAGLGRADSSRSYARRALAIQDRTGWRLGREELERLA
jgi:tetratricopeptide (TPR) repeat protein